MRGWLFFLMFLPSLLFAQESPKAVHSFSSLKADSVVLYDFNKRTHPGESIVVEKDSTKCLNKFEKSVKLDTKKASLLTAKIEDGKSYGGYTAMCFDPHLGIVFYKQGLIAGYIDVCMDCNRLEPSLTLTAQNQGKQISETGEVYYTQYGMSKSFRKYLNTILKQYNFSHQTKSVPSFY